MTYDQLWALHLQWFNDPMHNWFDDPLELAKSTEDLLNELKEELKGNSEEFVHDLYDQLLHRYAMEGQIDEIKALDNLVRGRNRYYA